MISVYDNFFTEEIRKEIFSKLTEPHWGISCRGNREIVWHCDGLEKQEYFNNYLYGLICKKLNRNFKSIGRIYANGQTAGQCGTPHIDDGDLTFLYYPAPEWHITWQGHLIFLNKNKDGETIVIHKPNRGVLFNGNQLHYADAPTRFFNGFRISLAYKLLN